jgi:hypothetical protein
MATGGSSDRPQSIFMSIDHTYMAANSPSIDGNVEDRGSTSPRDASDRRKRTSMKGSYVQAPFPAIGAAISKF